MKKKSDVSTHYVTNKELLEEFKKYRETGKISDRLGEMFVKIAENLSNKPNFIGYTWKEEMIGEAVLTCIKYSKNFNPDKSKNPFGYISRFCYNAFVEYIKKQKRHGNTKETLYMNKDLVDHDQFYSYKSIDYTNLMNIKKDKKK
jgi:DNA-directed RNA polymerase specialized sigma24 family protein